MTIHKPNATPNASGQRWVTYYEPMLALKVGCGEHGTDLDIVTVPNFDEPREIRWTGRGKPSVTLQDGWRLESFGAETSTSEAVTETIAAIGTIAAAVIGVFAVDGTRTEHQLLPGLYHLKVDGKKWSPGDPIVQFGPCATKGAGN